MAKALLAGGYPKIGEENRRDSSSWPWVVYSRLDGLLQLVGHRGWPVGIVYM